MRKIRSLIYCILLATTPSLFSHSGHPTSFEAADQMEHWEDTWDEALGSQSQEKWRVPATYDEIIDMLEDLEFGNPEEK